MHALQQLSNGRHRQAGDYVLWPPVSSSHLPTACCPSRHAAKGCRVLDTRHLPTGATFAPSALCDPLKVPCARLSDCASAFCQTNDRLPQTLASRGRQAGADSKKSRSRTRHCASFVRDLERITVLESDTVNYIDRIERCQTSRSRVFASPQFFCEILHPTTSDCATILVLKPLCHFSLLMHPANSTYYYVSLPPICLKRQDLQQL